ncbi:unnamed protein product [Cuscuta europaea]|uniref:Uncharacterized protein n=1 Tax=Cuscuta europaea TaxID=41803 RepID=A0A9P0Z4R1_CUSEU|nr:unnamed protein product [Cuscuta europaea]
MNGEAEDEETVHIVAGVASMVSQRKFRRRRRNGQLLRVGWGVRRKSGRSKRKGVSKENEHGVAGWGVGKKKPRGERRKNERNSKLDKKGRCKIHLFMIERLD